MQEIIILLLPVPKIADLSGIPTEGGNTTIESFSKSKRYLLKMHLSEKQLDTFYCGSTFNGRKKVLHRDSGYAPATSDRDRETRLEWEHVVPAYAFGMSFPYWSGYGEDPHPDCFDSKGSPIPNRKCTEKNSKQFRYMQADLHNLRPVIGAVNGLRSNYEFGEIRGESREFGDCDMEIDSRKKRAEPPEGVRGDIGRTYLYMAAAYPDVQFLTDRQRRQMEEWSANDPVDAWECKRERLISRMQGNRNAVVKAACEQAGL
ncbi:endonuclease I [candidate division KSB3 bacterium]|uniref:Endonuclease I n=1 Tax=candidate division KSB3 bacterium TaxID=2044937 RepID=A0A2G6E9A6_9BACT|nr:MAG: endonuclease I [candidate division KSB3 bacterium]PIE29611.1 MAG: endonuclease I [candidate division KSB3 bacterium]